LTLSFKTPGVFKPNSATTSIAAAKIGSRQAEPDPLSGSARRCLLQILM